MRTHVLSAAAAVALAFTATPADAQVILGGYTQPYYGGYQPYGYQSSYGGIRVVNGYSNYNGFSTQRYYGGGYNNYSGGSAYRSYGGNYGGYRGNYGGYGGMGYGRRR